MNKAKMTFRFDGERREVRPVQPAKASGGAEAWAPEQDSESRNGIGKWNGGGVNRPFAGSPSAEPVPLRNSSGTEAAPHYRAVEPLEEWGDPFTDHTGIGLTVFPGGGDGERRRGTGYWEEDDRYDEREDWFDERDARYSSYYSSPHRTSWWKVAGSLTGAIVTGALFGFVVLSLFNQDIKLPLPGIGASAQDDAGGEAASLPAMAEVDEEGAAPEQDVPRVSFALPEQTYYFLQYGVFSTPQGVQLAQEELQASGIAAARDTVDQKRVYAGVSTDREQSKLLSGQLKDAGVHLILHEISFPAAASVRFSGEAEALELFMEQSAELVRLLSSTSASLLAETEPDPRNTDVLLEQLGPKHQIWTESAAAIRGKWSRDQEPFAGEMEKAINSAVEAMGEYQKNGAKTLLWEVQNEMMRFIMAEQSLVNDGV